MFNFNSSPFDFKVNFLPDRENYIPHKSRQKFYPRERDHRTINNFKMSKKKIRKTTKIRLQMGKVFFLLRLTAKFLAIFPHWLCCVVVRCQVGGWEDKNVFIFTTLKDGKATKQLKAIMRVVFLWCHRQRRRDISRGVFKKIAFVLWCGWEYFVRICWWGG